GIDRAAQADESGPAVLRQKPGRVELVMHGRRAEVPQDRLAGTREQCPTRKLVALPFADLCGGDVANVVDVEDKERTEIGFCERLPYAGEAITGEPAVVDALLEVDSHGSERRQRAAPVEARVDVLGANLANGLVHGDLPCRAKRRRPRALRVIIRRRAPVHIPAAKGPGSETSHCGAFSPSP